MTKTECLHYFWSSFGLPAYDEQSVPAGENAPQMPYITYETVTDSLDNTLFLNASLWYKGTSWTSANAKAEEIAEYITTQIKPLKIDEKGYLWITKGSPFAQRMGEPTDATVRRILLNIQAEFLTAF